MISSFLNILREHYVAQQNDFIPLHTPIFQGNEKKYLLDTIDSTFVSSVGAYVDRFEEMMKEITDSKFAVATVNGTSALHIALHSIGVGLGNEVITQPLSFVATVNAIRYLGADPIFLDVDRDTMGLSPNSLEKFLKNFTKWDDGKLINTESNNEIKACIPMHTFGYPCRIEEIVAICDRYHLTVIEDSAESLGSTVKDKHTGTFGKLGIFSFNGNKTVTCGGGGALVTNDIDLGKRIKHLTTTAKVPHKWEYFHDELGFNYRMPNLNAALACAQLEQLDGFLKEKRKLSDLYKEFFKNSEIIFKSEIKNTTSNYWLNTIEFKDLLDRDEFLKVTNENKVMTRPAWNLLNTLPMFKNCITDSLENAKYLVDRLVNIPSSVKLNLNSKV